MQENIALEESKKYYTLVSEYLDLIEAHINE